MELSEADILYLRLIKAAGENNLQRVQNLLQQGADPNHGPASQNQDVKKLSTPLQFACRNANEKIVEVLINNEAETGIFTDNEPLGPLCLASVAGSVNIVRQILNNGR